MMLADLIKDLQSALEQNDNKDVRVQFTIANAHAAGDVIDNLVSVTYVGQTTRVVPVPSVSTPGYINFVLQ
jgi:hypothetical protein